MELIKKAAKTKYFIREGMLLFRIEAWFAKTIELTPYKAS
jgi:hypothetical protein